MDKKIIEMIVEIASDGTYGIYSNDDSFPFTGIGSNLDEAKQSLFEGMRLLKESCIEDGYEYPAVIDEDFELKYKMDVQSFLEYYSGIITPTALGRIAGIHPKQVWAYMHGKSKPRRVQIEKIQAGLHRLGAELSSISF